MGRTKLRGAEVGGLRIAVEAPGTWSWSWPEHPWGPFACSSTDHDVYVSVRVGRCDLRVADATVYELERGTFEVGRHGRDWLAVVRDDRGDRVARFSPDFAYGEVVVSPRALDSLDGQHPLAHPLDELLVLHRIAPRGGLLVRGQIQDSGARSVLRVGAGTPGSGLARSASGVAPEDRAILGVIGSGVRVWSTPWGRRRGDALPRQGARLESIQALRAGERAGARALAIDAAVDELASHVVAPIHAPELAAHCAAALECLASRVPVVRVVVPAVEERVVPFAWGRREAALGLAPPASA